MEFLNRYKLPIIAIMAILGFFYYLHYLSVSPLKSENARIKLSIKEKELENKALLQDIKTDSLIIVEISKKILRLEKSQQKHEAEIPKIKVKNEKEKHSYLSADLIERRRKFAKLANE